MRLREFLPEIAQRMSVSLDGYPPEVVADGVRNGDYALMQCDGAFAVVSQRDDLVTIEAVEGKNGGMLFSAIANHAKLYGFVCEAWAKSMSRVRLAAKYGFTPTGETRLSYSGLTQYRVIL